MRLTRDQLDALPVRLRDQIVSQLAASTPRSAAPVVREADLQKDAAAFLRHVSPDVCCVHPPNEGRRSVAHGAMLKAEGLEPGAADWIGTARGRAIALELKTAKGSLSGAQKTWRAKWERAGGLFYLCRDMNEVCAAVADALGANTARATETAIIKAPEEIAR